MWLGAGSVSTGHDQLVGDIRWRGEKDAVKGDGLRHEFNVSDFPAIGKGRLRSGNAVLGEQLNQNRSLLRTMRHVLHYLFAFVLQHRLDGSGQIFEACLTGFSLAVGLWHFRANGHEPFSFMDDDR